MKFCCTKTGGEKTQQMNLRIFTSISIIAQSSASFQTY
jgi:hypothetical protein